MGDLRRLLRSPAGLLLTTRTFGFDDGDVLALSARVAAEKKGGGASDFRDGSVSFSVVDFTICLEASTRSAYFLVDGHLVFQVEGAAPFPQQIALGIGMVTIRPLGPGGSSSLRGQGMLGRWSAIRIGRGKGRR